MQEAIFARYFTVAEEKHLFKTVKASSCILAQRDYLWMLLLRQTGLRIGAMSRVTVYDARQALRDKYLQYVSKGNKPGKVFTNKKAMTALRLLLRIRREMGHPEHPDMPLVMSRRNAGLSVRSYQARMKEWCALAGLKNGSPHWFRHTLGKRVMQQSTSADPRAIVQGVLNHEYISTTVIYTRPDKEEMEQAMEQAS